VIEEIAIGGTHNNASFRRPSSGAFVFLDHTPGVPLRSTPGFRSDAPSGRSPHTHRTKPKATSWRGRREHAAHDGVLLRSTPGLSSSTPFRCSRGDSSSYCDDGVRVLAPQARRIKARSAAQQTPGIGWARSSNPWQGVAEKGLAPNAGCLQGN
jgi:hypothetical protein